MAEYTIPFSKPFIIGKELYYIAKAVTGGQLAGDGRYTKQCQNLLEEQIECNQVLLTHSGTAALEMAAILAGVGVGDEVIMPSFTFVSTANAIVLRGATPVFVDIREDTLNIDEKLIEAAITDKTKVILVVHYAGLSCDMDSIMALAKKYGLYVIEDAAHAIFSKYKNRYLGTIGDFGCFSFHETKNIISGEGGALAVNNPDLGERAEIIREKGTNRTAFFRGEVEKYTWVDEGSSFLPGELISAFLYAQLENATKINVKRQYICEQYMKNLQTLQEDGLVRLPEKKYYCDPNGHIFYILVNDVEERGQLLAYLKAGGIYATFHYIPLHSSLAGKKYGYHYRELDVTNKVSETIVRLPLFYELRDEEVLYICERVLSFYRNERERNTAHTSEFKE